MNKKFISLLLIIVIVISAAMLSVSAANNYRASFAYDKTNQTLVISGKCADTAQAPFVVTVVPQGIALSDLNDSNMPTASRMGHTSSDGSFIFSLKLPDNLANNTYNVYFTSDNLSANDYFVYVKENSITNLLPLINSATSAEDLKTNVLDTNKSSLGIDTVIYSDNQSANVIANYIYSVKPAGGYPDATTFSKYMDQANAWALIKKGNSVNDILKKYSHVAELNYETEFMSYPETVKVKLAQLIPNADYTSKPFNELIKELRLLAYVKVSPTWSALEQGILGLDKNGNQYVDNFSLLEPENTNYNKLTNKNAVFMKMFENLNSINSFANVKTSFENAVATCYTLQTSPQKPSGSGSGSGSGSVGSIGSYGGSGQTTPTAPSTNYMFADMNNHWAADSVNKLAQKGVISGFPDGTFRPDQSVTRAEFLKILTSSIDANYESNISFSDVSDNDWFAPYVKSGYALGLVTGNDQGMFMPNNPISREDACIMIFRYIGKDSEINEELTFEDKDLISDYALNGVAFLYNNGIINGTDSKTFAPKDMTTRAQAATLILRVLDYISAHR
ncbi:MAG: S-layer homology domain-containing protein [Clostridia bacterium]|nr:S-layer homology domain-containing protein [Clostridia bacterium]